MESDPGRDFSVAWLRLPDRKTLTELPDTISDLPIFPMKKAAPRSPIESKQKTGPDPLLPPYLRKSRVRARWRRG